MQCDMATYFSLVHSLVCNGVFFAVLTELNLAGNSRQIVIRINHSGTGEFSNIGLIVLLRFPSLTGYPR